MKFPPTSITRANGFSLIELVAVIILLGIISVYAGSRFIGVKSFSGYAAQDQAMTVIRQIQLGRMQSNVADESSCQSCGHYRLLVTNNCLGSQVACTSLAEEFSDRVVLDNTELSFSPALNLQFDLLGNPYKCNNSFDNCSALTATETIFINDVGGETFELCINRQGYIGDDSGCE